jgi:hypothetical protein
MGSHYIFANTGQLVRIAVQTTDGYTGEREDGYVPIITSIIYPDLSVAAGYPQNMTRLDTGLYIRGIQLPIGVDALGSYIVNVYWQDNGTAKWELFIINVARPFGNSSVTPI